MTHKRNEDQVAQIVKLSQEGCKQADIARQLGLSRQRVSAILANPKRKRTFRFVYPAIDKFLVDNDLSIYGFLKMLGYKSQGMDNSSLAGRFLRGQSDKITIRMINKILEVTGLTYEEAFGEVIDLEKEEANDD